MNTALADTITQLRSQWRSSVTLRFGVLTILLILLLFTADKLLSLCAEKQQELKNTKQHNAKMEKIAHDANWLPRSKELSELRTKLENSFYRAETVGLAQSNIRIKLLKILKDNNLPAGRLKVEPAVPVPSLANCYSITAKYYADMQPGQFFLLLALLEKDPLFVVTDRFTFSTRAEKNASLTCHFFCIIKK